MFRVCICVYLMYITCCFWQPTCVLQIIKKNKTLNDVQILNGPPPQFRLAMRRQKRTKCDIFKNIVLKKNCEHILALDRVFVYMRIM